jgi:outer membrane receptor protein involved in Fe transport
MLESVLLASVLIGGGRAGSCLCSRPAQAVQAPAPASALSGVVHDPSGAVVAGAEVIARSGVAEQRTTTDRNGRFALTFPRGASIDLIVRADSFAERRLTLAPSDPGQNLDLTVTPAGIAEAVTVTATRDERRVDDVPASVTVLSQADIRQSPAVVADDLLRQVPTFSLFRRTSSIAAHPTAQGVSLRGIGPSGVSRTLVLLDGVPFNDPFGGWVYWSRVPLEAADRIEVVDGSSSSLYGNYAMGGVINILTSPPAGRSVQAKLQYGSRATPSVDLSAGDRFGKLGVSVDLTAFDTDGYAVVAPAERGAVDNRAAVAFRNAAIKLDYTVNDRLTVFGRAGHFHEERDNGKASTIDGREEANDTTWTTVSGGIRAGLPDRSQIEASVFVDDELFHSNFLAVPAATPARSIGRMTLLQAVPTSGVGSNVQWLRALGAHHAISAGLDWRWVDGESQEQGLDATFGQTVTLDRRSGGRQQMTGAYVQDLFSPTAKLVLTLSARADHWRNYDGHNLEHSVPSGLPTANDRPALADRADTAFSPHAAARYHLTDRTSVWAGVSSGFRAPTLNELYRQFRVGTVLTLANDQLGPERLVSGEGGISLSPRHNVVWRTTAFVNQMTDPVANVTITQSGNNVTQQRQNLGKTRIWGVQTDADLRIGPYVRLSAAYLFNQAKVLEIPPDRLLPDTPSSEGKFLPQVPEHRGSVQVTWAHPRLATITASVIAIGRQYDDDQNLRGVPGRTEAGLPGYATVDLTASREPSRDLQVFVAAQNLFDQQYFVGTLPTTIGSPRFVSVGVRVNWNRQ